MFSTWNFSSCLRKNQSLRKQASGRCWTWLEERCTVWKHEKGKDVQGISDHTRPPASPVILQQRISRFHPPYSGPVTDPAQHTAFMCSNSWAVPKQSWLTRDTNHFGHSKQTSQLYSQPTCGHLGQTKGNPLTYDYMTQNFTVKACWGAVACQKATQLWISKLAWPNCTMPVQDRTYPKEAY